MKIVFFGTPQFAVPTIEALIAAADMEVMAVVTQPDKRRGRGKQLIPAPVKTVAVEQGLPVWQPSRIKQDGDTLAKLADCGADVFVVVAYGQILSPQILAMPRLGCVNGHGSILPEYRGAAPIQWGLVHGRMETGITTMLMDEGMDTGAMLLKRTIPVGWLDTCVEVADSLATVTADLLLETIRGLDQGRVEPVAQDQDRATYAPLIKKEDYTLDWHKSAIALHNQIRGFYPNCTTTFREQDLKIKASLPIDPTIVDELLPQLSAPLAEAVPAGVQLLSTLSPDTAPGTVVALIKNVGGLVMTGDGLLLIREAQLAGKRSQSGWDFVNGTRMTAGEILGL